MVVIGGGFAGLTAALDFKAAGYDITVLEAQKRVGGRVLKLHAANKIVVTAKDGRTIECDDVVLAVPPTTWKKIDFSPGLPEAMSPQMGLNTKYLAHVKARFWEENKPKLSQYALSDGLIQETWDATDAQVRWLPPTAAHA